MKFLCSKPKLTELILVFIVLISLSGCQKEQVDTEMLADNDHPGLKAAKITNLMVITKSETLPADLESKLTTFGEIVSSTPEIGVVVLKPFDSGSKKQIEGLEDVRSVVPDLVTRWIKPGKVFEDANPLSIGSDDTYFNRQWGMDAIDAPEAWNTGNTGKEARVFILDSGIDADHSDLAANINKPLCTSFVPGEGYDVRPGLYFNHGTHTAGIIGAVDNTRGVIGVAPNAEIVAVKVLSEYSGSGAFSWINAGIIYAANNGADVINMSLGGTFYRNGMYQDENEVWQKVPAIYFQELILAQQRAITYAYRKGATIVVSAGNDYMNGDGNKSIIKLPADLNYVISVSATAPYNWYYDANTSLDIPASYTNYGKSLVDIAAPGGDFDSPEAYWHYDMVFSTTSGGYTWAAGTSMAAPHVSGVAALIIAKNGGQMKPLDVRLKLLKTADPVAGMGTTAYFGKGRVNAYRAVTE